MRQKALINLSLDEKYRTKALRIVFSDPGMESFSWKGAEKNQLEVVGDVDLIKLVTTIRKKYGYADVVSVAPVKEEKPKDKEPEKEKEKEKEKGKDTGVVIYPNHPWQNPNWIPAGGVLVDPYGHPYTANQNPNICSIM